MVAPTLAPNHPAADRVPVRRTRLFALPEMRWAAFSLGLFLLGLATQSTGAPSWTWWALYLACYGAGGREPALAGLQALREKTLDVDLLMVVAAIGAATTISRSTSRVFSRSACNPARAGSRPPAP